MIINLHLINDVLSTWILLGVLGIQVKIMLPHDPTGKSGPKRPLPDQVSVVEPKDEARITEPYSETKNTKAPFDANAAPPPQI